MFNTVIGIEEEYIYDIDFLNNEDINKIFDENENDE